MPTGCGWGARHPVRPSTEGEAEGSHLTPRCKLVPVCASASASVPVWLGTYWLEFECVAK